MLYKRKEEFTRVEYAMICTFKNNKLVGPQTTLEFLLSNGYKVSQKYILGKRGISSPIDLLKSKTDND